MNEEPKMIVNRQTEITMRIAAEFGLRRRAAAGSPRRP
jgi:hypothetical protein